jgi:hypothetical protein
MYAPHRDFVGRAREAVAEGMAGSAGERDLGSWKMVGSTSRARTPPPRSIAAGDRFAGGGDPAPTAVFS